MTVQGRYRPASRVVRVGAILLIGLLSGAMVEEYIFLHVILRDFAAAQWLQAHARFADVHPFTVIPAAIVGVLLIFLTFVVDRDIGSPRALATWGAAIIGVVIAALTAGVMMPMNDEIAAAATGGPPPNWAQLQERWISLQALRAALSVTGFVCLVVSTQLRGKEARVPAHSPSAPPGRSPSQ